MLTPPKRKCAVSKSVALLLGGLEDPDDMPCVGDEDEGADDEESTLYVELRV